MRRDSKSSLRTANITISDLLSEKDELLEAVGSSQEKTEGWIGRTLKLKFIFDEIQKIGILPEDHASWILPMVEDIEIPEVSRSISKRFLPSHEDAHIEYDGGEVEQEAIYSRLSQEAAEHSAILGDDPEGTIAAIKTIQKMFRGYSARRMLGGNPKERIAAATIIQKVFRGFKARPIVFHDSLPSQRGRVAGNVDITFINTGNKKMSVCWVNGSGGLGKPLEVEPGVIKSKGLKTFIGHWFNVIDGVNTHTWRFHFINITKRFVSGSIFDLATGITFDKGHWNIRPVERQRQSQSQSQIECDCSSCRQRRRIADQTPAENLARANAERLVTQRQADSLQMDIEEDEDYSAQLRIAIQMSLEQEQEQPTGDNEPGLIDDFPDYSIGFTEMFQ